MKLSSDKSSPDYHDVANFIDQIMIDGVVIKSCISFDTEQNEALCVSQPIKIDPNNKEHVAVHTVKGKIDIVWKPMGPGSENGLINPGKLFLHMKQEWELREKQRVTI